MMGEVSGPAKRFWHCLGMMVVLVATGFTAWGDEAKPVAEARVAVVNGAPIMRDEFEGEVLLVQKTVLGSGKPLTCALVSSVRKEVIESMVRRELLYQESRNSGVRVDQAMIDKELDALKKQFPNEVEYRNELNRRNLSEETLRARLEQNLVIQQYVEREFGQKIAVADNDMRSYYESRLDLFKQPAQARVSDIFIQTIPTWEEPRKQEARRKAEQVAQRLKKGTEFAVLAEEYSDAPTRMNGGDMGYISKGQLEKQLEGVVLSLKPGETSGVIETSEGFHVLKVTERKPETTLAYDDVKDKIRQVLREKKARQEAELRARKLRETADVKILVKEEACSEKRP